MASVNFLKCKSAGHAKAIMRHSEKEERLIHNHSNPDIDKEKTVRNSFLYGLSYEDMCQKYDDRIRLLDETTNTNKRSDRVTMFSLEYPVPDGLPGYVEESFLEEVEKIIAKQYGERNIIESERHIDEKHAYIDPRDGEKKVSRAHGHTFVIPEIDGKLNGKRFSSKSNMMKLNKAIDQMAMEKFKVHYMTGEHARRKSVEELKIDSVLEVERTIKRQHEERYQLTTEKEALSDEVEDLGYQLQELQAQYRADERLLEEEYTAKKKAIAEKERLITEKATRLSQREKSFEGRRLELSELREIQKKTFWSSEDKENVIKTALEAARSAEKAKVAIKARNDSLTREKSLKGQIKAMTPKFEDYDRVARQVEHRDETLIPDLEKKIDRLESEIRARDDFISKLGLKEHFIDFCKDMGYKVKQALHDITMTR